MAEITVKDESIEVETTGYMDPEYHVRVSFDTPETLEKDHSKVLEVELDQANGRNDATFDQVQERIDEYLENHFPDLEVENIRSVMVYEKEVIKSGFDLD